jgi:hypothetical protein
MEEQNIQAPQTAEIKPAKPKNPFKTATIILTVAVLLLGGGLTYALIKNNLFNEQENINNDSESDETEEQEDEEDLDILEENNSSSEANIEVNTAPYMADGYFYIPEWGVKYKLSDELTEWGYSVLPNSAVMSFNHNIGLTAFFKVDIREAQAQYFDTINTCSIATISMTDYDADFFSNFHTDDHIKVVKFNNYAFVLYDYRAHGSCTFNSEETNRKISQKLFEILSKPENI